MPIPCSVLLSDWPPGRELDDALFVELVQRTGATGYSRYEGSRTTIWLNFNSEEAADHAVQLLHYRLLNSGEILRAGATTREMEEYTSSSGPQSVSGEPTSLAPSAMLATHSTAQATAMRLVPVSQALESAPARIKALHTRLEKVEQAQSGGGGSAPNQLANIQQSIATVSASCNKLSETLAQHASTLGEHTASVSSLATSLSALATNLDGLQRHTLKRLPIASKWIAPSEEKIEEERKAVAEERREREQERRARGQEKKEREEERKEREVERSAREEEKREREEEKKAREEERRMREDERKAREERRTLGEDVCAVMARTTLQDEGAEFVSGGIRRSGTEGEEGTRRVRPRYESPERDLNDEMREHKMTEDKLAGKNA